MKHKGFLNDFFIGLEIINWEGYVEWKEQSSMMFRQQKIGQESVNPLGYGVMKGDYLHNN